MAVLGVVWLLMPRGFPARWIGTAALLPLFLIVPAAPADGDLRLTVLDVGQGLAVVAQTQSHALLYYTGPGFGPQTDRLLANSRLALTCPIARRSHGRKNARRVRCGQSGRSPATDITE